VLLLHSNLTKNGFKKI